MLVIIVCELIEDGGGHRWTESNRPGSLRRMTTSARFRAAYAEHRAAEGRGADAAELLALPYPERGPWLRQWQVRARTWECLLRAVVAPLADERGRALQVLDLGAGNGWLCF